MKLRRKYDLLKEKLNLFIVEPKFKEKINSLLNMIEQDLYFKININKKTPKSILKITQNNDIEIISNDFIKISIFNKRVSYKTIKTNFTYDEMGEYYISNNHIFVNKIQKDITKEEEIIRNESKVFTSDLEPIYYLETYDCKRYNKDTKKIDQNFNFILSNCYKEIEYKKIYENIWVKIETTKYYIDNMKNMDNVTYSIGAGNQFKIIEKNIYDEFFQGKKSINEIMNIKTKKK